MIDAFLTDRSLFRRTLSLFGLAIVTWSVIAQYARGDIPAWAFWCVLGANAVWLVLVFLPSRFVVVTTVCVCLMVLLGGIAAAATQGVGVAPAAVGVLWQTRDVRQSVNRGVALGIGCMLVVLVGNFISPISDFGLVAMEAGIVVAFLGGESRRQTLLAQRRANELVAEQARADVLAARQHIAHDIHDVLAHSLGGLVIQLDAVDALLESGEVDAATARVRDARTLAADGLSEARRAVAALREPPADASATVAGETLVDELNVLFDTHRSLGGIVDFRETGTRAEVSEAVDSALRRAVQEGLTNARKHAPGAAVHVRMAWTQQDVTVRIENRAAAHALSSSGHGLVGMRERFAALPGGRADASFDHDSFVVTATAALVGALA
jgi:signal transduction histidine kinase